MNFVFKMMNFVFKMMNFVFKMMNFVFKMMVFRWALGGLCEAARGTAALLINRNASTSVNATGECSHTT